MAVASPPARSQRLAPVHNAQPSAAGSKTCSLLHCNRCCCLRAAGGGRGWTLPSPHRHPNAKGRGGTLPPCGRAGGAGSAVPAEAQLQNPSPAGDGGDGAG